MVSGTSKNYIPFMFEEMPVKFLSRPAQFSKSQISFLILVLVIHLGKVKHMSSAISFGMKIAFTNRCVARFRPVRMFFDRL